MIEERMIFTVSDPWEFEDENGFSKFHLSLVRKGENEILVRADNELLIKGVLFELFVISPRYEDGSFEGLNSGDVVHCNATGIPPNRAGKADLFDLSWWRGGGTLIGTLRPSI